MQLLTVPSEKAMKLTVNDYFRDKLTDSNNGKLSLVLRPELIGHLCARVDRAAGALHDGRGVALSFAGRVAAALMRVWVCCPASSAPSN